MKVRITLVSIMVASSAIFTACGGGGGGSVADTSTTPAPILPTPVIPPPVASVPTIADAIAELNRLRVSAGVNPVTANNQVMTAAQNHATYLIGITTTVSLHTEDPAKAGFMGATPVDRVKAAGYIGDVGEVIAPNSLLLNTQADPLIPLRSLLGLPYHGFALLLGNRDVGVGLAKTANGQTMYTVIDITNKPGEYVPIPAGEVRMWPCNGVDNILQKSISPESPNPIPGRNLETSPIGTPIYVMVTEGKSLVLTTYELRNMATGDVEVIAKVLGQTSADGLLSNQNAILPDRPLAINTIYTATVTGLNDGRPFTKVCTFKTGNLSASS